MLAQLWVPAYKSSFHVRALAPYSARATLWAAMVSSFASRATMLAVDRAAANERAIKVLEKNMVG